MSKRRVRRYRVPVKGPTGQATNLLTAIPGLAAQGSVLSVTVHHDDGCPCTADGRSMLSCTCEVVDLDVVELGR